MRLPAVGDSQGPIALRFSLPLTISEAELYGALSLSARR
jgi:hypothetical protein